MVSSEISMTRLGERASHHKFNNDAEPEYERLRNLARQEAGKKSSCFGRAHQAYERGNGAEAKSLSNEGKRHQKKQEAYNRQASEFIFRENNAPGRVTADTIDLHGQFIEEAEDILEMRIRDARARGQTHLHVIVGKGNHSVGHVQKIKPRVEQVCQQMGLDYATEENEGRVYIDLSGGKVHVPPPLPQQPSGHQNDYNGGGYDHSQHQNQQNHHQQQQQDGAEELVRKLLRKAFRKMFSCFK